jgi:general L-amino acid transport system permease protein
VNSTILNRFFGTIPNTILTFIVFGGVVWLAPALLQWLIIDAVWFSGDVTACRDVQAACWAFIHEKYRFILFGRYPFDEQWRPLLAVGFTIIILLLTCSLRYSWRLLAPLWAIGIIAVIILMRGGILGLSYIRTDLWGGLPLTIFLALGSLALAFPLSIALAFGRQSRLPVIRAISRSYIECIRGIPLVSLLFLASFMLPLFLSPRLQIDVLIRALAAITLFSAAYLAETIRGGLQAIPPCQKEAALALGLSTIQTQMLIILPQALRHTLPAITNLFLIIFKNTSLVGIIGLTDLLLAAKQALIDPSWRAYSLEAYLFISIAYGSICFSISRYSRALENRLHKYK